MGEMISVVIPNHNGGETIGTCLAALMESTYDSREIIVVDDGSTDDSVEVISRYPCTFVRLERQSGASRARNVGARSAIGRILFFLDADCVVGRDTLDAVADAMAEEGDALVGGTYTRRPYDQGFFNTFQSIFVHHAELKKQTPDYVATHAMAVRRELFERFGGFREDFLPILEDVEFSHRLRRAGVRLVMRPGILVSHIFGFNLWGSLRNAFRKTLYWTVYSIMNGDLLRDSGTASHELKMNVLCYVLSAGLLLLSYASGSFVPLAGVGALGLLNFAVSRGLLRAFRETDGPAFAAGAALYYFVLYPAAVGSGALAGLILSAGMKKTGRVA